MQAEVSNVSLADLLTGIVIVDPVWDRQISGVSLDSRLVSSGDLFVAITGTVTDGRQYIAKAIEQGAVAVIAEAGDIDATSSDACPIFQVENLTEQLGKIAARFYGYPSRRAKVIGVTGTNGKTSITHYLAAVMDSADHPAAVIGTVGYGRLPNLKTSPLTTPDQITLQKWLAELVEQNCQYLMMEVSSHALAQQRVSHLMFDTAIFTNLTHDHLDYHGTMKAYGQEKLKLFQQLGLQHAVVNLDDPFSTQVLATLNDPINVITTSTHGANADVKASEIECHSEGLRANVHTPWGEGELECPLFGKFNIDNLLAVIATACLYQLSLIDVLQRITHLQPINGRMEHYHIAEKSIFIDYAHTPDALTHALTSLREHFHAPIWCVFGCGGGRDRGKRSEMGAAVAANADHIIITNDNPRQESPEQIIVDIQSGIDESKRTVVEMDRRLAIEHALTHAKAGDVILIAGKGHEDHQVIGDQRLPFRDANIVKAWAQQQV